MHVHVIAITMCNLLNTIFLNHIEGENISYMFQPGTNAYEQCFMINFQHAFGCKCLKIQKLFGL